MSETTRNGCSLWAILIALIIASSGIFIQTFSDADSVSSISPTSATSVSTSLLIATVIPQDTTDAYFVVENNQITYTSTSTLGTPCYYVISGEVFDLEGEPFTNFIVNIRALGEFALGGHGYAYAGEGGDPESGPSGWGALLPEAPSNYEIWLTDGSRMGGSNGIELSSHIFVESRDCDHNEASVNFVQVRPLP